MPYTNPVVAVWDDLGYTYCIGCAPHDGRSLTPVDCGNCALEGCVCDGCGVEVGKLYDPSNRVPTGR